MKLICQNCGNSRAAITFLGLDKHFLFAGDQGVTFVNPRTEAEFIVPNNKLVNSSFECPICAEKDSVRLAIETVT